MNRAMYVSASGMAAEQAQLDVIANNLANADVAGYKENELEFSSLTTQGGDYGVVPSGKQTVFKPGTRVQSSGPFDLAIDGAGFFAVRRPDGSYVYTRNGQFHREADGTLRTEDGYALDGVHVPANATGASVDRDGTVHVDTPTAKHTRAGQIRVALFASPELLRPVNGTSFEATAASGRARFEKPGTGTAGSLQFGYLEKSNVSVMESMMEILTAQRAFEANAKGVQAADEMQRIANNIQRS